MAGHGVTKKSITNPRSKSTTNIAAQFSPAEPQLSGSLRTSAKAPNLERIEAEYIKNLQQQIYFLELEANYLREQVRKSTDLQPKMTAEAKRMILKLKDLQKALEATRLGIKHKDSEIEVAKMDKERTIGKLRADEDSHQREKRLLLDEIVQLKNEKALLDRSISNKDAEIADTERRLEISQSSTRTTENKLRLIEEQLTQKCEQVQLIQQAVDEKRAELLRAEDKLHQSEELYYSSNAVGHDKVKEDLREEVRLLRLKVKEMETAAAQDRSFQSRATDESGLAMRDNAHLRQQLLELESEIEVMKTASMSNDFEYSFGSLELTQNRDREHNTASEIEATKEELKQEQEKFRHLQKQEQMIRRQLLSVTTAQSSLAELTAKHEKLREESRDLRTEKDVLAEHVNVLQKEVDEKQKEILEMEKHVHSLERKLKDLEYLQGLQSSIQGQKWDEFGRLAESMIALSETMAHSHSTGSPKPRSSKSNSSYVN